MKKFFKLAPTRHVLLLLSALIILFHFILRGNHSLMASLSDNVVKPIREAQTRFCAQIPFSLAELLIALLVIGIVLYLIFALYGLFRRQEKGKRLYRIVLSLVTVAAMIYAGFCFLWGTYYYGDGFSAKSGFASEEISVEQLEEVTRYFADLANATAALVPRNDEGLAQIDREQILSESSELYVSLEDRISCLKGPDVSAKGIVFSKVMSMIDFTGFFFPFTGEANVNMDSPSCMMPATVAHELAHLRGVAKEQEANFVAVLACTESEDAEFLYSGALLAYTHLGNALYSADYDAWLEIYSSLNASVQTDLQANNTYWAKYDHTVTQKVSNSIYEGFLYSYSQNLGLKSYGACVDLIVNYYYPQAQLAMESRTDC